MNYVPYAGGNTAYPIDAHLNGTKTVSAAVTAYAGGGQANATALTSAMNLVTVCASGNDSVRLPVSVVGMQVFVANLAATNTCQVYGAGTDTINAIATGTGVALPTLKNALFICAEAGKWRMILTA